MAFATTPKKVALDTGQNCQVCFRDLIIVVGGRKVTVKRRDLTSKESKPILSELKDFFPEIECGNTKAFICQDCLNKFEKVLRIKNRLKTLEAEYKQEKDSFISVYSEKNIRQKRVLNTPQRPRLAPKQIRYGKSPSKIPVFILPRQGIGKENAPITDAAVFQKRSHVSPSKIPVASPSNQKWKMQCKTAAKSRKMLVLSSDIPQSASATSEEREETESKNQQSQPSEARSFQAQIQYNYPSQIRKKIVDENQTYLKLVRAMLDGRPKQIANAICTDPQIRTHVVEEVCQKIKEESEFICRTKTQSVLQNVEAQQLLTLEWTSIIKEWQASTPTLLSCLTAITSNTELSEKDIPNVAFAGSVLLRGRNHKMSAVSHIIGLLLDYGGAHDSTIKKLAAIGASVSPKTINKKKNEISQLHDTEFLKKLEQYNSNITNIAESVHSLQALESLSPSTPCIKQTICIPKLKESITQPSTCTLTLHPSLLPSGPIYTLAKQPTSCQKSLTVSPEELNRICNYTEKITSECSAKGSVSDRHTEIQVASETLAVSPGTTDIVHNSFAETGTTLKYTNSFHVRSKQELDAQSYVRKEIYGDNCDIRVNAGHQTSQNRTKDYHWFITLAADLRVEGHGLNEQRPQLPIYDLKNIEFLPSDEDNASLKDNFKFHILKVITENISCLKQFQSVLPKFINHEHMEEMKKKGNFDLIDLHDKNESKSEDMIDILSDMHNYFVPSARNSDQVISRVVFGGDVLTNERAYQAQLDMINGDTASEKLLGLIHRPEGLHRLMNFMLYIYETFYLTSSVNDRGTMYQLKCFLDRRDVKLDMTVAYRQCKNFFDDVLDGHIVSAACHYFGISDMSSQPVKNRIPYMLQHSSTQNQLDWLECLANDIIDIYVMEQSTAVPDIYEDTNYMESQLESLQTQDPEKKFRCSNCQNTYKQFHWLKRHMKDKHGLTINLNPPQRTEVSTDTYDGIFNVASAFLKVGLLFRDTDDAYKMGDGNRLLRNAKYELLHFDQGHHIKYRLWMWRMLAYAKSLLSEKEAYEYIWNMSFNFGQGLGHLIPNDNLVEINVHLMKEQCRRMGANVTYEGARKWVKCLKFLHDLSDEFDEQSGVKKRSTKHTQADREAEINTIVNELSEVNVFEFQPGREHRSFVNFSSDVLEGVNIVELNKWITHNKKRAAKEMQL